MSRTFLLLIAGGLAAAAAAPASAEPRRVSNHQDWAVYVNDDTPNGRVCYAVTDATELAPQNLEHGRVVLMVGTWASGARTEQVMFHTGYELRPSGPTRARVGSDSYRMFVDGQDAFVYDDEEAGLVRAMRRGATIRIEAMSSRGNATAYSFSLSGVTAALRAVENAC